MISGFSNCPPGKPERVPGVTGRKKEVIEEVSVLKLPDAAACRGAYIANEEIEIPLMLPARELPVEVFEAFFELVIRNVEVDLSLGQVDMNDISVLDHSERTALCGFGTYIAN